MLKIVNIGVHVFGALIFPFGIYNHYKVEIPVEVNPIESAYGQKFKYLTFIDEIIQSFYFLLCLVCDIILVVPSSSLVGTLDNVKDYFFTTFAFPLGSFVAITFWGLFAIDRELVMPAIFDQYFARWLNHIVHTLVIVLPLLELFTSYRRYYDITSGLIGLVLFNVVYLVWIHIVYSKCNLWVYPILEKLNLVQRFIFLGFSVVFTIGLYFLGLYLNNLIWPAQSQPVAKKTN